MDKTFIDVENGWFIPAWKDESGRVYHLVKDGFYSKRDAEIWLGDHLSDLVVVEVRGGIAEVVYEGSKTISLIIDYDNQEVENDLYRD